jgi:DNA ligase-1
MVKAANSRYEPSKRSDYWLKLKKDYIEDREERERLGLGGVGGTMDSLDLVPIGAWYGHGRKSQWFSPFLMAAYDESTGKLQSVCRCMSGFTDVFYKEMTEHYQELAFVSETPPSDVVTDERPAVWFRQPAEGQKCEVWELRGADITLSPVHKAGVGLVHPDRGLSLRFPRFVRKRPGLAVP